MKTLRKRFRLACWVLLLGAAAASVCYAQFSGNIQGVISDPSGAVIAGASVSLRNVDTGIEAAATTSASGNYRFSSLEPGNYRIAAQASGFRKITIDVRLGTSQTQGINITLPLATASQAVNVTSQAPPLDTDDTRLQATLSSTTVRDLPEINRNIYDVLSVAPGVVGTGTRGAGESPGGGNDNSVRRHRISAPTAAVTPGIASLWTAWTLPAWCRTVTLFTARIPTPFRRFLSKRTPGTPRTMSAARS